MAPGTENNLPFAELFVPAADIALAMTVDKAAVIVGDEEGVRDRRENLGPTRALMRVDPLPAQQNRVDARSDPRGLYGRAALDSRAAIASATAAGSASSEPASSSRVCSRPGVLSNGSPSRDAEMGETMTSSTP